MDRKKLTAVLGKAAREARNALGLTQADMAEQLDVTVEFYGRVERGVALPRTDTLMRLVQALDVSADVLLGIDPTRAVEPAPLTQPDDPPELLELIPLLCQAPPSVLRLVSRTLTEFERAQGKPAATRKRTTRKRSARKRGGSTRKPPTAGG